MASDGGGLRVKRIEAEIEFAPTPRRWKRICRFDAGRPTCAGPTQDERVLDKERGTKA